MGLMKIKRQDIIDLQRHPMREKHLKRWNDDVDKAKNGIAMQFRSHLNDLPDQLFMFPNSFEINVPIIIE